MQALISLALLLPSPQGLTISSISFYICFCQGSHIRIFLIKSFHHHVHSGIRALGCQPHTYQQLPRIVIIQCTVRIWIRFLQTVDDLKGQFFFSFSSILYRFPLCFRIRNCLQTVCLRPVYQLTSIQASQSPSTIRYPTPTSVKYTEAVPGCFPSSAGYFAMLTRRIRLSFCMFGPQISLIMKS